MSTYLFSIDFEDIRFGLADGLKYQARVPANVHRYLEWLNGRGFKCTFFVVGDAAEAYPSLVREIASEGHEIACHTNRHVSLDRQSKDEFRTELEANVEALLRAGAPRPAGFRAPNFSIVPATAWAYDVLGEMGFVYSSSVLPAKNPLYGWKDFGERPRIVRGIVEIPMTVGSFGPLRLPIAGGVYFRALPQPCIRRAAKRYLKKDFPLLGYFHPYDIDAEQERFMHPEINDSRLYNFLMYYNRKSVFERLDAVVDLGFTICTYAEYVRGHVGEFAEESG